MTRANWRTPIVVLICGVMILLIAMGVRNIYGLLLSPISADMGWRREVFSFAIALQTLVWGLTTPVAGVIADRFGSGRVVATGGITFALGLYVMSNATSPFEAMIGVGFLTGIGMSARRDGDRSFGHRPDGARKASGACISASRAPAGRRASSSSCRWVIWPSTPTAGRRRWFYWRYWSGSRCRWPRRWRGGKDAPNPRQMRQSAGGAILEASGHSGFLLLTAGYFVCGFQTMFIGTHLPAFLDDLGYRASMAATAIALIGFFNVIGCFLWGAAGGRHSMKYLLSSIYVLRSVVMTVFFLLPITEYSVYIFAGVMGLLWLGTIPLVTGLIAHIFGLNYIATLSGLVFFSHQIGSFLGIWLGGLLYDASGTYDVIWWSAVILGVVAALIHFPIDDRPLARLAEVRS